MTRVPEPGADRIVSRPPTILARSCIPSSPSLLLSASSSNRRVACRSQDRRAGVHTNVPAEEIEGAVWGVIDGMLSDVDVLASAIGASRDADAGMAPAVEERIEHHERRLGKARLALTRLRRLFLEGDIDDATYRADKGDYERQVAMLNDELERMRAAQAHRGQERASQELMMEIARRWHEIRQKMTDMERRELRCCRISP